MVCNLFNKKAELVQLNIEVWQENKMGMELIPKN